MSERSSVRPGARPLSRFLLRTVSAAVRNHDRRSRRHNVTGLNSNDESETRRQLRRRVDDTGGRAELEAMRDVFTNRLHRRSDDFDATFGLRLVTAKLQRTSYGEPFVTKSS